MMKMNSLAFSHKTIPLISKPTICLCNFQTTLMSRYRVPNRFVFPRKGLSIWKCIKNDPLSSEKEAEDEDDRALRAVLKLYDAVKKRNIHEVSEIFGDECRCGCNFFPLCRSFRGKKQVMAFFSYLMRSLGSNVEVVFQPTLQDGMIVGVSWRLEWNKNNVPLGKGISFHICQIYQGKVLIRNVEMIMEPLLHLEPVIRKILAYVMRIIVEKIGSFIKFSKGKEASRNRRAMYILLATMLLVAPLMFFL